jgi:hypothetical protein
MHRHHLKPTHSGGKDVKENLTPLISVVRHSMFHWCEWQRTGNTFDKIAWKALSGLIDHEEARILANKEWHKQKLKNGNHPFQVRGWDESKSAKKASLTQIANGTLNLLYLSKTKEHSERVSNHQKVRVINGTHHFLGGNETWDRSSVSRRVSREAVINGTCALLSQNRTWNESALAKKTREEMDPEKERKMIRKQTVNRRIKNGWTVERLKFIKENKKKSSGLLLKDCQELYGWPNSRGAIQNIIKVLENEPFTQILDLVIS